MLFIDTSHTVKTGGDVTWIFARSCRAWRPASTCISTTLPARGLPGAVGDEGWGWNESYLVRSFLSYNSAFEVVWGTQYMLQRHHDERPGRVPGRARGPRDVRGAGGGASRNAEASRMPLLQAQVGPCPRRGALLYLAC